MRKRGWGRRSARLLDKVRDARGLGLGEVTGLDRVDGSPEGLELGITPLSGGRQVAVVASRREGLDLLGWAWVAAYQAGAGGKMVPEVVVAAPIIGSELRRAAEAAARRGPAIRLVALPSLDDGSDGFSLESFPPTGPGSIAGTGTLADRVARILDGAVAAAGSGAVRAAGDGHVVYVSGERVARVVPGAEGVNVEVLFPENRTIAIQESDFSSSARELQDFVAGLAKNPRLSDGDGASRDRAVEEIAENAGARVTARFLPWNSDGSQPIDWVGVDAVGRPLLGAIRDRVDLADVPGLIAAALRLQAELETWVPGATGSPRLVLTCQEVSEAAQAILAALSGDAELAKLLSTVTMGLERAVRERPARGDRPERGRRGERADRGERVDRAERSDRPERSERPERGARADRGDRAERSERQDRFDRPERSDEEGEVAEAGEEGRGRRPRRRSRRGRRGRPEEAGDDEAVADEEREGEGEGAPLAAAALANDRDEENGEAADDTSDPEIEGTLEASEADTDEVAPVPEPEPEPVRVRRSRAAIIVRDDPDSILAALVMARDRRNIVSFRVVEQEGLMDFFRGPATDIQDNTDVVLVGFSAQPRPREVLDTAELFRGRLQWIDHHEWPIEDLERLRDALGRDSIEIVENGSSPLAAVGAVTERRSRFTDKLLDLSARRLSENDMTKWGYRLSGLCQKMAANPGEHRPEILPVLSGKPAELPEVDAVFQAEQEWVTENDARIVHFGEYEMAVCQVPAPLDPGEVGRKLRQLTGARLSLARRSGEDLLVLGCNEEKRPMNVVGLADQMSSSLPWASARLGGDRVGRLKVEDLEAHPERMETVIGEIVRNRSMLYG